MALFRTEKIITRAMLRAEPDTLFVFGDNMSAAGLGGQAKVMRGEPNAVGIPTKWLPSRTDAAYFTDADYEWIKPKIEAQFRMLADHLRIGGKVVWPEDGIGTGLAELPARAPAIYALIQTWRELLEGL